MFGGTKLRFEDDELWIVELLLMFGGTKLRFDDVDETLPSCHPLD